MHNIWLLHIPSGKGCATWCRLFFRAVHAKDTSQEILDQTLWYNSNIKINGQIVFWEHWYKKGVMYISDLMVKCQFLTWDVVKTRYRKMQKTFLG